MYKCIRLTVLTESWADRLDGMSSTGVINRCYWPMSFCHIVRITLEALQDCIVWTIMRIPSCIALPCARFIVRNLPNPLCRFHCEIALWCRLHSCADRAVRIALHCADYAVEIALVDCALRILLYGLRSRDCAMRSALCWLHCKDCAVHCANCTIAMRIALCYADFALGIAQWRLCSGDCTMLWALVWWLHRCAHRIVVVIALLCASHRCAFALLCWLHRCADASLLAILLENCADREYVFWPMLLASAFGWCLWLVPLCVLCCPHFIVRVIHHANNIVDLDCADCHGIASGRLTSWTFYCMRTYCCAQVILHWPGTLWGFDSWRMV